MNTLFQQRSQREKIMLLLTLLVAVLWIGGQYLKKSKAVESEWIQLRGDYEEQSHWIGMEESIRSDISDLFARMDTTRMMDADDLAQWVDSAARETNAQFNVTPGESSVQRGLNRHNVRLSLERIPIDRLINFVLEVDRNSPYVLLDEIIIDPISRTPDMLNVRLRITSQETTQTR